jgi:outer membrane lipoprotein SlyB
MKFFPSLPNLPIPALLASMLLSACASTGHGDAGMQSFPDTKEIDNSVYGRVEAIQVTKIPGSDDMGVGSVVGGLIGGLIANQMGGGNGKTLATVAGVGGGAIMGNQFEQNNRPHEIYKIRVQLDSGDYQTVSQDNDTDLTVGNRVHIDNGRVYRY